MTEIFRVQDAEGRGPFRPGFSRMWIDESEAAPLLPTWMQEFGEDVFARLGRDGEHYGSAVRTLDGVTHWFNANERRKLAEFGFHVVSFRDARVLAESPNQLVFARRLPLNVGATIRRWP